MAYQFDSNVVIKEGQLTKSCPPGINKKCSRRHFRLIRLCSPFKLKIGRKESLGKNGIPGAALMYYENEVKMQRDKYIRVLYINQYVSVSRRPEKFVNGRYQHVLVLLIQDCKKEDRAFYLYSDNELLINEWFNLLSDETRCVTDVNNYCFPMFQEPRAQLTQESRVEPIQESNSFSDYKNVVNLTDSGILSVPSNDSLFYERCQESEEPNYDKINNSDFRNRVQTEPTMQPLSQDFIRRCKSESVPLSRSQRCRTNSDTATDRRISISFNQEQSVCVDVPSGSTSSVHVTKELKGEHGMAVTINFKPNE